MKKQRGLMAKIFLLGFSLLMLFGCSDSSTTEKNGTNASIDGHSTVAALTGDVSLFPNSDLLVSGDDIKNQAGAIIIDTRSPDAYAESHIPGAINIQWNSFVVSGAVLKPVSDLEKQLGELGISRTSRIVIYDDTVASWGAAGRLFWMFEYLGCINVAILNGGWDKWKADGRETETTVNTLAKTSFEADLTLFAGNSVDKEYIAGRLGKDDFVVVDTRTDEEFNGWTLYGEKRGGHIKGAVQIPYADYYNKDKTVLSYKDLKALFDSNGITSEKEVVSYCTAGIRSGYFYFLGRLMGLKKAANYDGSMFDWAAADENTYPMEKLTNYQALVYPGWVDKLIKGENPPTYSGNGYAVLFTSYEARYKENRTDYVGTPYEKGHIPGAIFLDTYSIENGPNSEYGDGYQSPEEGNVKPISELQALFGNLGIKNDMTVVVYADDDISMMTAGRMAWALMLAGVKDVRILNGNYKAWVDYGGEIETTPNTPKSVTFGAVAGNENYLAAKEDLQDVIDGKKTDAVIADDRDWTEFTGQSNSYYPYFHSLGRIKTARWIGDWTALTRSDKQSFKPFTSVEKNWRNLGFSPDKKLYFYCGTGWRSGLYTFYAYLLGWDAANYDGGWFEWSSDKNNPVEKGNFDKLVSAADVQEMISRNNDGKPYVIVETGWGKAGDEYNNGHLPGAIWVNTDEIEYDAFNARNNWPVDPGDPPAWDRSTTEEEDAAKGLGPDDSLPRNWWNIYPDKYLLPAIAYMGIDKNTTVVVYGKSSDAAARVLWTLMYAGVEDVRFLNGGKDAWTKAGYELETKSNSRHSVNYFDPDDTGRVTAIHPEYKVDIPFVRDVVNGVKKDAQLVDIRTKDEYIGASRPYSYIPTDGRIPGAIWGSDSFTNSDGTLIDGADVYTLWQTNGVRMENHLSFYCGTAWRSSLAWFYAYMMGYENISNFDSSWFEWSMGDGSAYSGADPVLNPIVDDSPDLPATK